MKFTSAVFFIGTCISIILLARGIDSLNKEIKESRNREEIIGLALKTFSYQLDTLTEKVLQ